MASVPSASAGTGLTDLLGAAGAATELSEAVALTYPQRQAVDRQRRNPDKIGQILADGKARYDQGIGAKIERGEPFVAAGLRPHLEVTEDVLRRLESMERDLTNVGCPRRHPQTVQLFDFIEQARSEALAWQASLEQLQQQTAQAADLSAWPTLEADRKHLTDLTKSYRMGAQLRRTATTQGLAEQFAPVQSWRQDTYAAYEPLLQVTGGEKSWLHREFAELDEALGMFQEATTTYVADSERAISQAIAQAHQEADRAVRESNPTVFRNGVANNLNVARDRLAMVEAIVGPEAPSYLELLTVVDDASAAIDGKLEGLIVQLVAEVRAPPEVYAGGEKEQLRRLVRAAWAESWPEEDILSIRFHNPDWETRRELVWDVDRWREVHMAYLYVKVIVDSGSELATIYVAVVNKDHTRGGELDIGVQTRTGHWRVDQMLKTNL